MGVIGSCCCGGGGPVENPCSCWDPLPDEVVISGFSASQVVPAVCEDDSEEYSCDLIPGSFTLELFNATPSAEACYWYKSFSSSPCIKDAQLFLTDNADGTATWALSIGVVEGSVEYSKVVDCEDDIFDAVTLDLLVSDCDTESSTVTLTPTAL